MKKSIRNFRLLMMSIFIALISLFGKHAQAQPAIMQSMGYYSPGGFFDTVVDGYGNKYSLGELSANDSVRSGASGHATSSSIAACTPGYFRIYLSNASGMIGAAGSHADSCLQVLCQVLTDISSFIPSPCTASHQTVNIYVADSTTGVLGKGIPFYIIPTNPAISGIADNAIWITLNSGTDAFTDVVTPLAVSGGGISGSTYFHGSIMFNWGSVGGSALHWHLDMTTAPAAGEVDLYTVAFHEMMHVIGFGTLINYDGSSVLGPNWPYYTRYDTHLETQGLVPLITDTSTCTSLYQTRFNPLLSPSVVLSPGGSGVCPSGYQTGALADHTPCGTALQYSGSWSVPIPVYNPLCFERGSSLSHFEDECYVPSDTMTAHSLMTGTGVWNNQYYAISNAIPSLSFGGYDQATNPGAMKRYLKPEERQVLCDIGYATNATFGNASNLNNTTYASGSCSGFGVAGIDDGIRGGSFTFSSTGGAAINISADTLLSNDYGVTGGTASCMQVVIGSGTVTPSSAGAGGYFTYHPGAGDGLVLLRYVPKNASGVSGNITYVFVHSGDVSCTTTPCNLLSNGGFESTWSGYPLWAHCWQWYCGTPDLFERGYVAPPTFVPQGIPNTNFFSYTDVHPFSPGANNEFVGMISGIVSPGLYTIEGIYESLTSSLVSGQTYTISFWAKLSNVWDTSKTNLMFALSPSGTIAPYGSLGYMSSLPTGLTQLDVFTIHHPDTAWHLYTDTITYMGPTGNSVVIIPCPWVAAETSVHYIAIDDIEIVPSTASSTFTLPDSMNICTSGTALINLNDSVSIPGGTWYWQTLPVTGITSPTISNSNMFDPLAAYMASISMGGHGLVNICYSYTDGSGCTRQICRDIQINPALFTLSASPNPDCSGAAVTITCTGPSTFVYNWLPAVTCTTPCNIATATPTATTIYTVTETTTGCSDYISVFGPLPAISGTASVCGSNTTTLSDSTIGGVWSSGSTTVATITGTTGVVYGVGAGSAVITYTMPSGCFITDTVSVNDTTVPCTPCTVFSGSYTTLGVTGTIDTSIGAGNYYIANDVHITGNRTFTGAVILIAPGVHIYIDSTSSLTLNGCHLFCCGSMWGGIVLQTNTGHTSTGRLALQSNASHNTLIEDARIAVDITNPAAPAVGGTDFLVCNGVIFNKNYVGVSISGYNPSLPLIYPFKIQNSVFTCRDFSHFNTGGLYPNAWPNTDGTRGLKTSWTGGSAYDEPYNIANPNAGGTGIAYSVTSCNVSGLPQYLIGIRLTNIGTGTLTYAGIVIGTPTTLHLGGVGEEPNLFESLSYGIMGADANVIVHNCAFAHIIRPTGTITAAPSSGGAGIYVAMDDNNKYKMVIEPSLSFFPSANYFYNCNYGVYALNYDLIKGDGAYMVTAQNNTINTNSGTYGYDIQTKVYDNINVSDNTIVNVANGIVVKLLTGLRIGPILHGYPGQTTINNNNIRAKVTSGSVLGTHYVDKAIWVENALTYIRTTGSLPAITEVNTNSNTITDAYNGIYINGVGDQTATSNSNTIGLLKYPDSTQQYGIWHLNCSEDRTMENNITGNAYNDDSLWGVKVSNSSNHTVMCNEVINVGRGFEFENTHVSSTWLGNTMTNTQKGFVLTGGQIGTQGGPFSATDNKWVTSGGSFSWSGTNYQTYTAAGALPINSTLYVLHGAAYTAYDPTNNRGQFGSASDWYGMGTGSGNGLSFVTFPLMLPPCVSLITGSVNTQLLRQIATQGINYTVNIKEHNWMGQLNTYQAILKDYLLAGTSPVLNTFKVKGDNSRFALFTKIEDELALGNYVAAESLLIAHPINDLANTDTDVVTGVKMADDTLVNQIVENYRHFYWLCIHFEDSSLTTADSIYIETLASLCPLDNGAVVYKARALYDIVFDTVRIFANNCDSTDTMAARKAHYGDTTRVSTAIKSVNDATGQKYVLYPNPNDGNFILQQAVPDNEPVEVEAWDAIGRSIYKQKLRFSETTSKLQIGNVTPGVYLVQLSDSKGRMFRFKIIVE